MRTAGSCSISVPAEIPFLQIILNKKLHPSDRQWLTDCNHIPVWCMCREWETWLHVPSKKSKGATYTFWGLQDQLFGALTHYCHGLGFWFVPIIFCRFYPCVSLLCFHALFLWTPVIHSFISPCVFRSKFFLLSVVFFGSLCVCCVSTASGLSSGQYFFFHLTYFACLLLFPR